MKAIYHDLCAAIDAARATWHRCRWLRRTGGNPDDCVF